MKLNRWLSHYVIAIFNLLPIFLLIRISLDKYDKYKEIFTSVIGDECGRPELPIMYNVNVGHAYPIGLFPLGLMYEIDCDNKTLKLLEAGTE